MPRKFVPMTIAYDFDGTLADGNMQEHQFLPDIGMTAAAFWAEVKKLTKEHQADEVLVYMNLMLRKADAAGVKVGRNDFKQRGRSIVLFDGVDGWFDRLTKYARSKGVRLEHVLISSGNAEIFAGTAIASKFAHIYASKFMFDHHGIAAWPALAVNYTTKTQYLFRINKGAHDLSDNGAVNKFVQKSERAVPFENMIFIGDGSTDIPCFGLVKDQGGLSVAVYKQRARGAHDKADGYVADGRVHCVAAANYSEGNELDRIVKAQINAVAAKATVEALYAKDQK
jgi:phosphoserine phosphatase